MDLGALFLILALVLIVGLFITRPFYDRRIGNQKLITQRASDAIEHQRSSLMAERDRLLTALQELDFDYKLGKIPAEDYPTQRAALLESGAETLRQLDALTPAKPADGGEARLEKVLAARRAETAARSHPASAAQDELENLIAARKRERQEKVTGFCPKCGRPLKTSDRFCSRCGTAVQP